MKKLSVLLALAGVGITLLLFAWFDVGAVWTATISVGWGGFAVLLAFQGALFVLLGVAWTMTMPDVPRGLLIWGRMVRDSATNCLPFSPVGGFVIGARAITLLGVPWPSAAAGTVVDVTAEIIGQMLFALFGVAVVLLVRPGSSFLAPLAAGVLGPLGLIVLGIWQRRRVGTSLHRLCTRLLGNWFDVGQGGNQGGLQRLQLELARRYDPARVAKATSIHLAGWFATGVGTWISLRLLGAGTDMLHVLALEALLDALVAITFLVPGSVGVQEAGYVGIGALFGVPPDLALGVSLLRRAKDVAWGLPILAFWQWHEVRRLAA